MYQTLERIKHHSDCLSSIKLTRHLYFLSLLKDKPLSIITYTLFLIVWISLIFSTLSDKTDYNLRMCCTDDFDFKVSFKFKLSKVETFFTKNLMPLFITWYFLYNIFYGPEILNVFIVFKFKIDKNFVTKSSGIFSELSDGVIKKENLFSHLCDKWKILIIFLLRFHFFLHFKLKLFNFWVRFMNICKWVIELLKLPFMILKLLFYLLNFGFLRVWILLLSKMIWLKILTLKLTNFLIKKWSLILQICYHRI